MFLYIDKQFITMLYVIHSKGCISNLQITGIIVLLLLGLLDNEISLYKVFNIIALTISSID